MATDKIILLDLNFTLVNRLKGSPRITPFERQIETEQYRQWLVEMLGNRYVILPTARPERYMEQTLKRILKKTKWQPQEAYFSTISSFPHVKKEFILRNFVMPRHGIDGANYFAIESNPKTRSAYAKYGILSAPAFTENGVRISL